MVVAKFAVSAHVRLHSWSDFRVCETPKFFEDHAAQSPNFRFRRGRPRKGVFKSLRGTSGLASTHSGFGWSIARVLFCVSISRIPGGERQGEKISTYRGFFQGASHAVTHPEQRTCTRATSFSLSLSLFSRSVIGDGADFCPCRLPSRRRAQQEVFRRPFVL